MTDRRRGTQLIWATRGRSWVFRFLLDGGLDDPLHRYEKAFGQLRDQPEAFRAEGPDVAVRFPDPRGRRDTAGRVIPHEFVVMGELAESVRSVADGLDLVWPLVDDVYAAVWDAASAPDMPVFPGDGTVARLA